MSAKVVDVHGTVDANFGTIPGFGLALGAYPAPYLGGFFSGTNGGPERWAPYETGFGDARSQCHDSSTWSDTGLTISPRFDGGASCSGFNIRRVGTFSFLRWIEGSFAPCSGSADDGISCYDAQPSGASIDYSALYLGNLCDTWVDAFTLGASASAPDGALTSLSNLSNNQSVTFSVTAGLVNQLVIVGIVEANVSTCHVNHLNGWTTLTAPPDASGYALTLIYKIAEVSDTTALHTLTFSAPITGTYFQVAYSGVDPTNPIDGFTPGFCDGTTADAPAVSTSRRSSTVAAFVVKTGPAPLTTPGGWSEIVETRSTLSGNATLSIADKVVVSPGSGGVASFTGASAAHGAALMLSIRGGPSIDTFAGAPGIATYSGLPFQPDLLLFNLCEPQGLGGHDGTTWCIGAADSSGNQWAATTRSTYLSGATAIGGLLNRVTRYDRFRNDACLIHIGSPQFAGPTTSDVTISWNSMTSDGFTLNVSQLTGTTAVEVLAVKAHPGRGNFKVGTGTQPGGAGAQSFTGLGFLPHALWVGSVQETDQAKHTNKGTAVFGFSDGTEDRGVWSATDSGVLGGSPPHDPQSLWNDNLINFCSYSGLVNAQAHVQSLDADGFTLDWTTSDGVARLFGWVALAVDDAPVTQPVATTLPVTNVICNGCDGATNLPSQATFHGQITPNTIPGDPVRYYWEISPDHFGSSFQSSGAITDGSGTATVDVSYTRSQSGGLCGVTFSFCKPFCYRLVVITSTGCIVRGEIICTEEQATPILTFGNKFRLEP